MACPCAGHRHCRFNHELLLEAQLGAIGLLHMCWSTCRFQVGRSVLSTWVHRQAKHSICQLTRPEGRGGSLPLLMLPLAFMWLTIVRLKRAGRSPRYVAHKKNDMWVGLPPWLPPQRQSSRRLPQGKTTCAQRRHRGYLSVLGRRCTAGNGSRRTAASLERLTRGSRLRGRRLSSSRWLPLPC